uniref:Uncharacterized protein n=1 Tax=Strongyloides papillosus TaxID=174720 RepID=A0A0N5BSA8_STREA
MSAVYELSHGFFGLLMDNKGKEANPIFQILENSSILDGCGIRLVLNDVYWPPVSPVSLNTSSAPPNTPRALPNTSNHTLHLLRLIVIVDLVSSVSLGIRQVPPVVRQAILSDEYVMMKLLEQTTGT